MIPILFEYNATDFSTHGIGDLVDCVACEAVCNDDGEYEMSFTYPKGSELFQELTIGRLVLAKSNSWQQAQIFRIYGYEKEIKGLVRINCEHISYDLNRIPVKVFKAAASDNANAVLQKIKNNAVAITGLNMSKFTLSSNVSGTAQTQEGYFEVDSPTSVRAAILDGDNSVKGVFGGNLVFDRYNVKLLASGSDEGGMNRGVLIEYGVDLMDLTQEENISEMITGVLPYYRYMASGSEDETYVYGNIQYASGTFRNHKVEPLDITEYFPNQAEGTAPSVSQINAKAQEWINAKDGFGEPEVNLTLSYAVLGQDVRLHDQITVRFLNMGIDVAAKVTSYKYDVLRERMLEVEVGKTKKSILFSLEDASRLKKGLLPPKRIQTKSITSDKYADGSVQSAAIGSGAVGSGKIASGAVTSGKIGDGAVTESKVKNSAITVNKIANGAVIAEKIQNGAVTGNKVLDKAIALAKLSQDVQDQITYIPVLASDLAVINNLVAGHIMADGSVQCSSIVVGSTQYKYARSIPGTSYRALVAADE